jgi:hypothetical protein
VAAIAVLPDGRPVELGTFQEMGAPRCYLRLRDKQFRRRRWTLSPCWGRRVLPRDRPEDRPRHRPPECPRGAQERRRHGVVGRRDLRVGQGPEEHRHRRGGRHGARLAARPDVVAVCGSRRWRRSTSSTRSRCCCARRARRRGCSTTSPGAKKHQFAETARDCAFAGDTLVLVGEAWGEHDADKKVRDRLMMIESDLVRR